MIKQNPINLLCYLHFRFLTRVLDGQFYNEMTISNTWIHILQNFIGPAANQGILVYMDGVEHVDTHQKSGGMSNSPGVGRIIAGRTKPDVDSNYGSVIVDELLFFNQILSEQQALDLTNMI